MVGLGAGRKLLLGEGDLTEDCEEGLREEVGAPREGGGGGPPRLVGEVGPLPGVGGRLRPTLVVEWESEELGGGRLSMAGFRDCVMSLGGPREGGLKPGGIYVKVRGA